MSLFKKFQKPMTIPQREVAMEPVSDFDFEDDRVWNETSYMEKPKKRVYKMTQPQRGKAVVKQAIVDYLAGRKGKTSTKQIAKAAGVSAGYPPRLIRELVASKTISVEGKGYKKKYRVLHPNVRGSGKARRVSPKAVAVVTPGKEQEAILDYIRSHDGEKISFSEIARGAGVSSGSALYYIKRLEKNGSIVRRLVVPGDKYKGYHYWLKDTAKTEPVKTQSEEPVKMVSKANESAFVPVLEGLLWEYMKDTRRFNDGDSIYVFIEWLKSKGE